MCIRNPKFSLVSHNLNSIDYKDNNNDIIET